MTCTQLQLTCKHPIWPPSTASVSETYLLSAVPAYICTVAVSTHLNLALQAHWALLWLIIILPWRAWSYNYIAMTGLELELYCHGGIIHIRIWPLSRSSLRHFGFGVTWAAQRADKHQRQICTPLYHQQTCDVEQNDDWLYQRETGCREEITCGHKAKEITPLIAWRREAQKEEALKDLFWEDDKGPSSIKPTLELF